MKKKLNHILLIDDDNDNNFIHKLIIEDSGVQADIYSVVSVPDAIQYLQSGGNPDLIFLDINMPVLNGWDFINQYNNLPDKQNSIIVMLTSSMNVSDEKKALSISEITEYKTKPLTPPIVKEVLHKYFES